MLFFSCFFSSEASLSKVYELAAAVSKTVGTKCTVANLLCAGNVVLSGDEAACNEIVKQAESFGASKTVKLAVAGAFHSGEKKRRLHFMSYFVVSRVHASGAGQAGRGAECGEKQRGKEFCY